MQDTKHLDCDKHIDRGFNVAPQKLVIKMAWHRREAEASPQTVRPYNGPNSLSLFECILRTYFKLAESL